jgi:Plasmid replication region DNA-binding N-term
MIESGAPRRSFGPPPRGITQSDVSHAADTLLRSGDRPTIEKIRTKIGRGSPNTINPMLDAWWKTLSARLDAGPAALHRLPENVAHIAEALWMQALEEGKRRALLEQRDSARVAEHDKQRVELRSHVLTLREGELDSRLRDRDRTIEELNLRLRELTGALRKEQATRDSQLQRIISLTAPAGGAERPQGRPRAGRGVRRTAPNNALLAHRQRSIRTARARTPTNSKQREPRNRAAALENPKVRSRTSTAGKKRKIKRPTRNQNFRTRGQPGRKK